MERRKVSGGSIDSTKTIWATPLPVFEPALPPSQLGSKRRLSRFHPKFSVRQIVRGVNFRGESGSSRSREGSRSKAGMIPRYVASGFSMAHGSGTVDHGTLTLPIEVETEGTQTEESAEEIPIQACTIQEAARSIVDRGTSPISVSSSEKPLFEELEQITGHIIIQKFITRSQEEFQQLIKIRFPGMRVRETATTHTCSDTLPRDVHLEETRGAQSDSNQRNAFQTLDLDPGRFSKTDVQKFEEIQNEEQPHVENERHPTCIPSQDAENLLQAQEIDLREAQQFLGKSNSAGNTSIDELSESEDEPSLLEIKEVVMSPFTVTKSQNIPTHFEIVADVHVEPEQDEDVADSEEQAGTPTKSRLDELDDILEPTNAPPEVTTTIKEALPVTDEAVTVSYVNQQSRAPSEGTTVEPEWASEDRGILDEEEVDLIGEDRGILDEEEVDLIGEDRGILDEEEVDLIGEDLGIDEKDIEEQIIVSITDNQQTPNPLEDKANRIIESSCDETNLPLETLVMSCDDEEDVINPLPPSKVKSIATQTIARSSFRPKRCCHGRRICDSPQSSANSSSTTGASVLDLQLRVQKFDVRLRVGGKGQSHQTTCSHAITIPESEHHLDILQVHGTKIKLKKDHSNSSKN